MKKTLIALAAFGLVATAHAESSPAPEAVLHYQTIAAVSANQAQVETNRLLAITAVAQTGDDRLKDRAMAELTRGPSAPVVVNQWQPRPNAFLQFLGVVAQPLATLAGAKIQADTAVKLDQGATARQAITFGTINSIAQGGYNLGATGLGAQASAFEAGAAAFAAGAAEAEPVKEETK